MKHGQGEWNGATKCGQEEWNGITNHGQEEWNGAERAEVKWSERPGRTRFTEWGQGKWRLSRDRDKC